MCELVLTQQLRQRPRRSLLQLEPLVELQLRKRYAGDYNRGLKRSNIRTKNVCSCSSAQRMFVSLEVSTASTEMCHGKENHSISGTVSELEHCSTGSSCCSHPVTCFMPDLVPLSDCIHLRCVEQKEKFTQIGAELRAISDTFERHRKQSQLKSNMKPCRLVSDTVSLVQVLRSFIRASVIPYLHLLSGLYWVYP
ncbi:uncharacterized protein LOC111268427 [Varroa jacobsoni]|uniref:Uncharacterized protein n=1 Tax=Varroa destructor TaxID=109461 RepID=A0A7M7J6I4_VARDE|nr:uncharacterized protein LOC111244581 [Varroa destructor]XP_022703178.1 uncharacterized protein LOC111268427 [Varroa jacobsoni]